jgi:hypothetical protein
VVLAGFGFGEMSNDKEQTKAERTLALEEHKKATFWSRRNRVDTWMDRIKKSEDRRQPDG